MEICKTRNNSNVAAEKEFIQIDVGQDSFKSISKEEVANAERSFERL